MRFEDFAPNRGRTHARHRPPESIAMNAHPMFSRLGLAALLAFASCARAALQVADPLPSFGSVPDSPPPTADRVVLLDFWASWCAPCKASFPAFARLHREFAGKGLVIIAVGVDDQDSAHEAFIRKMHPPFFTMHDRDHEIVSTVGVPVMPTTYLFGRDGRLRLIHKGFHGSQTEDELHAEIATLLKEGQ